MSQKSKIFSVKNWRSIYTDETFSDLASKAKLTEIEIDRARAVMVAGTGADALAAAQGVSRQAVYETLKSAARKIDGVQDGKKRICLELPAQEYEKFLEQYQDYVIQTWTEDQTN